MSTNKQVLIGLDDLGTQYEIKSPNKFPKVFLNQLTNPYVREEDGLQVLSVRITANHSFVIRSFAKRLGDKANISDEAGPVIKERSMDTDFPELKLHKNKSGKISHVHLTAPEIPYYRSILEIVGGAPIDPTTYSITISRAFEVIRILDSFNSFLPRFELSQELKDYLLTPFESFDGTIESMFTGDIDDLVSANPYKCPSDNFRAFGYESPADFVTKKPRRYIDKTKLQSSFDGMREKDEVTFIGKIISKETFGFPKKYVMIGGEKVAKDPHAKIMLDVNHEKVVLMLWHRAWAMDSMLLNTEVLVTGKMGRYALHEFPDYNNQTDPDRVYSEYYRAVISKKSGKPREFFKNDQTIANVSEQIFGEKVFIPEIGVTTVDSLLEANALPIVPIYAQSSKYNINTKKIMNCVYEIMYRLKDSADHLATYIDSESLKMTLPKAISSLHFPKDIEDYKDALQVLALYELIYMQILILHKKETEVKKKGLVMNPVEGGLVDQARGSLPFALTGDQSNAVDKIRELMATDTAEKMILTADVGAGKTLVAQLACLNAVDNNYQAVLAAPTEVLSGQLYKTFVDLLDGVDQNMRPQIAYIHGGLKAAEKRALLKSIKEGEVQIIVGTHSVFSKSVEYNNLGLVCIDEEQKFGAAQRDSLLTSRKDDSMPDILTQTATPIPRSTAQVYYGDVGVIQINEKPAGREPIETVWIHDDPRDIIKKKRSPMWKDIKEEAAKGHKTFIVVPMVHENEKMNVASVKETVKVLSETLPDLKIVSMHGQMAKKTQQANMAEFKDGDADILIASTVIEVGVDVKLGTRMIILSADRLGASSLHQIRGRVGRNSLKSKCYLVSANEKEDNTARLTSLVDSNDGFEIAKVDLKTRGEGDLFGEKQSGDTMMTFANLVDHTDLIAEAQATAKAIYSTPRKYEAIADAKAILRIKD